MKLFIAQAISYIINPLSVALFAPFILVYRTTQDLAMSIHWTIYTLIYIMVLSLFVIIAVKKKIFTDLDVSKREQRPLMFLIALLFAAFYMTTLFVLHGPYILYILAISIMLGISVASIINTKIKASMHVAAITALIIPVAISYGQYYSLLILLIPLVAWARLKTKRHTMPEILVGGVVGALLSFSIYVAVKFFITK